jgi:hypothetical protein
MTRTFTIQGTWSWSASFGEDFPTFGGNRSVWYQTEFTFGEYSCNIIGIVKYVDLVDGYAGGATHVTPTAIPVATHCVPQEAGSKAHSGSSSAVTWTKSLGIGAGLGLQASIETGFDTSAQLNFTFSAFRHLCGWKSLPGGVPQQLVVRP